MLKFYDQANDETTIIFAYGKRVVGKTNITGIYQPPFEYEFFGDFCTSIAISDKDILKMDEELLIEHFRERYKNKIRKISAFRVATMFTNTPLACTLVIAGQMEEPNE